MVLTADQQQQQQHMKALLTDTITLLCKNGLHFRSEFSIEALIGITLDRDDVFLVSINETIKCDKMIGRDQDSNDSSSSTSRAKPTSNSFCAHDRAKNMVNCGNMATREREAHRPRPSVEAAPFVDTDVVPSSDASDVKLEFPVTTEEERRRRQSPDGNVESAATVEVKSFSDEASLLPLFLDDDLNNESDSGVSPTRKIFENLEPPSKRLRTREPTTCSDPSVVVVGADDAYDETVDLSKVCKIEPLDIVEIPDDDLDDSLQSNDIYTLYNGMGTEVQIDESAFVDSYLQTSQLSMPGCSLWNSGQRGNNRQKKINNKATTFRTADDDGITERFTSKTDEDLDDLTGNFRRPSRCTRDAMRGAVRILERHAVSEKTTLAEIELLSYSDLDAYLSRFYSEIRKIDGSSYSHNSLTSIKYCLQQHFRKTSGIDICELESSCAAFDELDTRLKATGDVRHRNAISAEEFAKLYGSDRLSTDAPETLQNKVFVDLMVHLDFCSRARLRELKRSDFETATDVQGKRYVYRCDDGTEDGGSSQRRGRMYEIPGDARCPVAAFEKYVSKLSPDCVSFWQMPKTKKAFRLEEDCWFKDAPLGKNKLGNKMMALSVGAALSKVYTNHCLRAISVAGVDEFEGDYETSRDGPQLL